MPLLSADQQLTKHSYYVATEPRGAGHAALESALECDVAIGGGLAGLSAAVELAQRGYSVVVLAIAGDAERFDTFARIKHRPFPGGRLLRTPAFVMGMAYYRLRDML